MKKIDNIELTDDILELEKKLSDRELKFCQKYVVNRNRVQSAILAGYSKSTAKQWAYRLVHRPHVRAYLNEVFRQASKGLIITAEEVIQRHMEIAFMDITDYVDTSQGFVQIKDLDKVDTTLIKKLKQTKFGMEIEFEDRSKSLDVLTKYLGIYSDNASDLSPKALANVIKYYTPNQLNELMGLLYNKGEVENEQGISKDNECSKE